MLAVRHPAWVVAQTSDLEQLHQVGRLAGAREAAVVQCHWTLTARREQTQIAAGRDRCFFQVIDFRSGRNIVRNMRRSASKILLSRNTQFEALNRLEVLLFISSDAKRFEVVFESNAEDTLALWRSVAFLGHFADSVPADKRNLLPVLFVLDCEALLNTVELDEATQDSGIAGDRLFGLRDGREHLRRVIQRFGHFRV